MTKHLLPQTTAIALTAIAITLIVSMKLQAARFSRVGYAASASARLIPCNINDCFSPSASNETDEASTCGSASTFNVNWTDDSGSYAVPFSEYTACYPPSGSTWCDGESCQEQSPASVFDVSAPDEPFYDDCGEIFVPYYYASTTFTPPAAGTDCQTDGCDLVDTDFAVSAGNADMGYTVYCYGDVVLPAAPSSRAARLASRLSALVHNF